MIDFVPYQRAGNIQFGMSQRQVEHMLGNAQRTLVNWLGESELAYPFCRVNLGVENRVVEILFYPEVDVYFDGVNIMTATGRRFLHELSKVKYRGYLLDLGCAIPEHQDGNDRAVLTVFCRGRMDERIEMDKKRIQSERENVEALRQLQKEMHSYSSFTPPRTLYCWRCKEEVPCLDEAAATVLDRLYRMGVAAARARDAARKGRPSNIVPGILDPALDELRRAYREMTGREIAAQRHKLYHTISDFGPPCPRCGKPLRTANAKQCYLCGWNS